MKKFTSNEKNKSNWGSKGEKKAMMRCAALRRIKAPKKYGTLGKNPEAEDVRCLNNSKKPVGEKQKKFEAQRLETRYLEPAKDGKRESGKRGGI